MLAKAVRWLGSQLLYNGPAEAVVESTVTHKLTSIDVEGNSLRIVSDGNGCHQIYLNGTKVDMVTKLTLNLDPDSVNTVTLTQVIS